MGFRSNARVRVLTALLASWLCAPAILAQTATPAEATTHFKVKDLADGKCNAYSNCKATSGSDGGQPVLKIAFGTGDGIFGGCWSLITPLKGEASECRGIALTCRGNGDAAGRAFLSLRTANGVSYRSKNIGTIFVDKEWHDVLLGANDFIVDPDSKNKEVASSLPKTPDWSTFDRLYFSAVDFGGEPTLEIKAIYFVIGGSMNAAEPAKAAPAPKAAAPAARPAKREVAVAAPIGDGPVPVTPAPKTVTFPEGTWMERHEKFVERAKQGDVDLLWLGDSITDNWKHFKGTYRKYYENVKAANFGIGGDQTQNLLWRLENGELDGIKPKVAILLVGTNNVQWHPSDQIAAGVAKLVQTLRAKCPTTKVLLLAIFPRRDLPQTNVAHQRIKEVNAIICKLDDGKMVRYLDLTSKLTNPDGSQVEGAFADGVHLAPKGFSIWAESMQPLLDQMMK